MKLHQWMTLTDINQTQLADLVGCSIASVSRHLNKGSLLDAQTVIRIFFITMGAVRPDDFYDLYTMPPEIEQLMKSKKARKLKVMHRKNHRSHAHHRGGAMSQDDDDWRWHSILVPVQFHEARFRIVTSHHPDGRVIEVGYGSPRDGSPAACAAEDACIILNALIQRHLPAEALCELIRRDYEGRAQSILGEIVMTLAQSP